MPKISKNKLPIKNGGFRFKYINFIVGVISICIIIPAFIYLYKYYFKELYFNDYKEATQIPNDVKRLEDNFKSNPKLATSSANPLYEDFTVNSKVYIPSSFKIPILLYHYVEHVKDPKDQIRISLNILPETLDSQIKTLRDAGYIFMTPSQIPDLFSGKMALPNKPVMLSFDDGYRDFYTDAFPIIKKYQIRVVAYIVSGFLDLPNNLTRPQLKEISDSGLVEIAAHTVDHAYLAGANPKRVKFEVEQSKVALESELHIPVVSFAYPYGAFDLNTIKVVKDAGFITAVSTVFGTEINKENLFFMYRLRAGSRSGRSLTNFLEQSVK